MTDQHHIPLIPTAENPIRIPEDEIATLPKLYRNIVEYMVDTKDPRVVVLPPTNKPAPNSG